MWAQEVWLLSLWGFFVLVLLLFCFFFFIAAPVAYVKFPGKGLNQSCSCRPMPQPLQHQIWAASAAYTAACSNARSLTHGARPRMEPASPQRQCLRLNFLSHNGNAEPAGFFFFSFLILFCFVLFLFWLPPSIWSSWARDQIQDAVVTYTAAVAMLDPLNPLCRARDWACVLVLQRCCWSHWTTAGTTRACVLNHYSLQPLWSCTYIPCGPYAPSGLLLGQFYIPAGGLWKKSLKNLCS